MYTRILVPLDGSELSEQVLPVVRSLATSLQAKVDLLRILEPAPAGATRSAKAGERPTAKLRDELQAELEQVAASLRLERLEGSLRKDPRLVVSCRVLEGEPAESILSEAARQPATLVAMCTHGRSGISRWLLGSVASKVLASATQPLLLVRAREPAAKAPEFRLNAIIAPLDGSSLAEQALPHIGALAKALGLKVYLVQATPPVDQYSRYAWAEPQTAAEAAEAAERDAREYLAGLVQRLRGERYPGVEERLVRGEPAQAILDLAHQIPGGLVVMTSHGRSGLGRWLLGSVADRVVRHAEGAVLVIRAAAGAK